MSPKPGLKPMLTYKEAAKVIGVPVGTLYAWVCQKRVPHVRYGPRMVRFRRAELVQWIEERRVSPVA